MMTPLDSLCPIPFHDAEPPARARVLSRLADTELFAALVEEPAGDRAELRIFDLPGGSVALACDTQDRLAGFLDGPVAYVGLPGRVLAQALVAEGRGLLVNPGHLSEMLLAASTLAWLLASLEARPRLAPDEAPRLIHAPAPEAVAILAEPVAQRLGDMAGLAGWAALSLFEWEDGRSGHVLVLGKVPDRHRDAVAKAFAELFAFLPEIEGGLDLTFSDRAPAAGALVIEVPTPIEVPAPRRDPKAPPRLR